LVFEENKSKSRKTNIYITLIVVVVVVVDSGREGRERTTVKELVKDEMTKVVFRNRLLIMCDTVFLKYSFSYLNIYIRFFECFFVRTNKKTFEGR